MPNCFSLTRIGDAKPTKLQAIDDAMRVAFDAPADAKNWYCSWYGTIGFSIACGQALGSQELRDRVHPDDADLARVLAWLEANYTSDAWCER